MGAKGKKREIEDVLSNLDMSIWVLVMMGLDGSI